MKRRLQSTSHAHAVIPPLPGQHTGEWKRAALRCCAAVRRATPKAERTRSRPENSHTAKSATRWWARLSRTSVYHDIINSATIGPHLHHLASPCLFESGECPQPCRAATSSMVAPISCSCSSSQFRRSGACARVSLWSREGWRASTNSISSSSTFSGASKVQRSQTCYLSQRPPAWAGN